MPTFLSPLSHIIRIRYFEVPFRRFKNNSYSAVRSKNKLVYMAWRNTKQKKSHLQIAPNMHADEQIHFCTRTEGERSPRL